MDREELRFRLTSGLRKAAGHVRSAVLPPRWRRGSLASLLAPEAGSPALTQARRSLHAGDWSSAHRVLASHFASRPPRFVLDPRTLETLRTRITRHFPDAGRDALRRADRVLEGRYDILGYRDIAFGAPPAWHKDAVHNREAPSGFWATIPYLDPRSGDHKVIWEINRHQHWLMLARAFQLTGDRRYYAAFVAQLDDWMSANPPLEGINWASMLELGFRSLSWIWSLHLFAAAAAEDGPDSPPWAVDLLLGLDRQLTHIEQNLSQYFSPNTHLTGEALALYVTGCALPELAASGRRTILGRRVLLDEIRRQINGDGGHRELSAHYHRYSTDFYLLAAGAARAAGDSVGPAFEEAALRQTRYLRTLADDTGRLPLIGDDDGGQLFPICGRAPSDCRDTLAAASAMLDEPALAVGDLPEEVFWLCGTLPLEQMPRALAPWPSTALPESGYYVSRTTAGDHLVFDAGRHGFLNGGHAHADALSIVLTVGGRPVLVDPGTAAYTIDAAVRDRFRSTAMHNTVLLNGRPQSVPRGPFHWQSTANARSLVWTSGEGFDYAEGIHDGYRPIAHARGVLALHGIGWLVIDHVFSGAAPGEGTLQTAEAFWHLHPDWSPVSATGGTLLLRHAEGPVRGFASSTTLQVLTPDEANGFDSYAPAYGRIERAACVRGRITGSLPLSFATLVPAPSATAEIASTVSVRAVPVTHRPGPAWHCAAFRVSFHGCEAIVLSAIERSPDEPAGSPGQLWGCEEARTDGRVALIPAGGNLLRGPLIIHGTRVETFAPAGLIRA
jgi:hypothetical protein